MKQRSILILTLALVLCACTQDQVAAPVAEKKPKELETHGDIRVDDYYWMRER